MKITRFTIDEALSNHDTQDGKLGELNNMIKLYSITLSALVSLIGIHVDDISDNTLDDMQECIKVIRLINKYKVDIILSN